MFPENAASGPLSGLRVIEISAFVAAPLAGMTLAQLGAEVIRVDPVGGGMDYSRWPLAPGGTSLYWASLNKGKKSLALALETEEGRETVRTLLRQSGKDGGIVLTNLPAKGWLDYTSLSDDRPDLILLRLTGNRDGSSAVDYTVNCASGFPIATGADITPVNHVLPAWDIVAGNQLCIGLLAAERVRSRTGRGQEVTVALSDVMLSTVANLGYVADVQINGYIRPPLGNALYGAFGNDFVTADGRRLMLVAITPRQWQAICKATGLGDKLALVGQALNVDLSTEGGLFEARDALSAVLARWCAERTLAEVGSALDGTGALWGLYQDFGQLVREDPRCSAANPMFAEIEQPGAGTILASGSALRFASDATPPPMAAPRIGQHNDEILGAIGMDAVPAP